MSDSFITVMMCAWVKYKLAGVSGKLGYKKRASFVHDEPHGTEIDYVPDIDEESMRVDACVEALKATRPDLYEFINLHYFYRGSVDDKADRLGCKRRLFYMKVSEAHNLILGWLNDLSCKIEIPKLDEYFKKSA
ncbi:MAG TPA: antiterminator Q family protein [Methylophilus sp.]|uniref:antiterminator Q family protein n=1 Tax=Methylophilus sp. TaxID=29541 RepID=UPI002B78D947|nr:antiterminator Q family protein [Methylophilus sp.]HSH86877.1 antiterminator Q family protein [Methylophilus sp.]